MTQTDRTTYDVVVVGGGPAGLSAALLLSRARRSVLVVDAGTPRNAAAAHVQGFLTRDGTPPAELLELGRAEVRGYGGEVVTGRVVAVRPEPDGSGQDVELAGGRRVGARRVLVATGLTDGLPDVRGLRERWGRDVLHCPYCHGWEVRDRAVGVLGTGPLAVHGALLVGQWTSDVVLFLHTAPPLTQEQREQLDARGVRVVEEEVVEVVVSDDRITGLRLASGEVVARDAVLTGTSLDPQDDLLTALGVEAVPHPMGVGSSVPADPTGRTAVPGVWVAGNVSDIAGQVVSAAAAGNLAGGALNADLVQEEVARAVAARRAEAVPA